MKLILAEYFCHLTLNSPHITNAVNLGQNN